MDIAIPAALITAATVVLTFVFNQALAYFDIELSSVMKKGIVFVVAVAFTGYYGYQSGLPLPDPGLDPAAFAVALLAYATAVFKAAQVVYDNIWVGLLDA